jgi:chromosome transmission fidelity protein 18
MAVTVTDGGASTITRGETFSSSSSAAVGRNNITVDGSTSVRESSRVILLSGPPGVGKSMLAHVICKHAGYRAVEVNASDERTGSALTERVLRAMEGTTLDLLGADEKKNGSDGGDGGGGRRRGGSRGGKPNCVILDEIDGADAKSSIAALVDIVRADVPPPAGSSSSSSSRGKMGRGGTTTTPHLRRPIILICNHKYAPALRPILPYALQFDVRPPDAERLAGRPCHRRRRP